jgi:RecB family exonuclease
LQIVVFLHTLEHFRNILVPENLKAKAEINLGAEHLMFGEIPVTGIIDHMNIDEENKTIEIYDFKTGGFHKENWEAHATLYKYQLQLIFYKLLLNLSPTYNKYKVTRAHILFVSPTNNDLAMSEVENDIELVHDKVYEYNETDEKDFKDLLQAVYKHIKSLDFIDEGSELAVHPDSTKGIKQILEFCELIKSI